MKYLLVKSVNNIFISIKKARANVNNLKKNPITYYFAYFYNRELDIELHLKKRSPKLDKFRVT